MQRWFWICVLITLGLLAVMNLWSFPWIAQSAGGLSAFDLRFTGYSEAEARAFLAALSDDGYAFYLTVQHRLDVLFPAFLAASLMLASALLFRQRFARLLYIIVLLGLASDFLENRTVAAMLRMPETVDPIMIKAASLWTVAKFVSMAVVLLCLLAGLSAKLWVRKWSRGGA